MNSSPESSVAGASQVAATPSIHHRRADAYLATLLGLPGAAAATPELGLPGGHPVGMTISKSLRRLRTEEGFAYAWTALFVRWLGGNVAAWLSVAPDILDDARGILASDDPQVAFGDKEVSRLRRSIAARRGVAVANIRSISLLLYLPREPVVNTRHPSWLGPPVRQIRESECPARVPKESIAAGTAFGVFRGRGELASFAAATPLATLTVALGVMLVGIETIPEYRKQGLARGTLQILTEHVVSLGRTPIYTCSPANTASRRTAESAGYKLHAELTRFQIEQPCFGSDRNRAKAKATCPLGG